MQGPSTKFERHILQVSQLHRIHMAKNQKLGPQNPVFSCTHMKTPLQFTGLMLYLSSFIIIQTVLIALVTWWSCCGTGCVFWSNYPLPWQPIQSNSKVVHHTIQWVYNTCQSGMLVHCDITNRQFDEETAFIVAFRAFIVAFRDIPITQASRGEQLWCHKGALATE